MTGFTGAAAVVEVRCKTCLDLRTGSKSVESMESKGVRTGGLADGQGDEQTGGDGRWRKAGGGGYVSRKAGGVAKGKRKLSLDVDRTGERGRGVWDGRVTRGLFWCP